MKTTLIDSQVDYTKNINFLKGYLYATNNRLYTDLQIKKIATTISNFEKRFKNTPKDKLFKVLKIVVR